MWQADQVGGPLHDLRLSLGMPVLCDAGQLPQPDRIGDA
jgi:hypothetical protein